MNAAIIINPIAGTGPTDAGARVDLARRALADARLEGEVVVTERHGHGRVVAADLARRGFDPVVAWGGDGTINEVGSALVGTAAALGIVPYGSGNGLSRELGLSRRPAEALRAALTGRPRPFDVGELAGRHFLNIGGVSFDAEVARRYNERPPGRRGIWPYVSVTLGALRGYVPDDYRVLLDGVPHDGRYFLAVFANSPQFGSRVRIAPGARPDDGWLDAVLVDHRSMLGQIWRARYALTDVRRAPGLVCRPFREATIEGTSRLRCQVDGEVFTAGERVEVKVHPGAIRLRM
jgi:YegS/Rv2252/BmrU family lipid kinase